MSPIRKNLTSRIRICVIALLLAAGQLLLHETASAHADDDQDEPRLTFDDHLSAVLRQRCGACHNQNNSSGGLDLSNYTALMSGGSSGDVIEPGDAAASYLFSLVTHEQEPYMPPGGTKIPEEQIELLRKWIDGGALENASSEAPPRRRPAISAAVSENPLARPESVVVPPRLPLEPEVHPERPSTVVALAASPWAPIVAVGAPRQVLLYSTESFELIGVLPFPEGDPRVLRFSRTGQVLLAGGGRGAALGRVVLWDVATGERITEIGNEVDEVLAADISADLTLVALGGPQRTVRVFSTESGEEVYQIEKHTDWVTALEFSPDAVLLASGDRSGGMYVWEAYTGNEYLTLAGHSESVSAVSWRSDSNALASGGLDGAIRLWEMNNGSQVRNWSAHAGGVLGLRFTRDGHIDSVGRDATCKRWNQEGNAVRQFESFGDQATAVTACEETGRVIAGDWEGEIRVWLAEDGKPLGELVANPPPLAQRLADAEAELTAAQQAREPLQAAIAEAEQAGAQSQQRLQEVEQQHGQLDSQVAELKDAARVVNEKLESLRNELQQVNAASEKVSEAKPLLEQAVEAARQAAGKLPDDEALKATVDQLAEGLQAHIERLSQLAQRQQQLDKEIEEQVQEQSRQQQRLQESSDELSQKEAEMNDARQQVEQQRTAVQAARDEASVSEANVAAAEQWVARWKDEIEFVQQLEEIEQRMAEAEGELQRYEAAAAEATAALENARLAAEQAAQNRQQAAQKLEQLQQQIRQAKRIDD